MQSMQVIVFCLIFRYSRKGYLYKHFVMNAIMAEGVKPTLAELEKFEEAPEGIAIELGKTINVMEGSDFV